eukprot:6196426-Pleurochrysis_carterae.AAC.2
MANQSFNPSIPQTASLTTPLSPTLSASVAAAIPARLPIAATLSSLGQTFTSDHINLGVRRPRPRERVALKLHWHVHEHAALPRDRTRGPSQRQNARPFPKTNCQTTSDQRPHQDMLRAQQRMNGKDDLNQSTQAVSERHSGGAAMARKG